VAALLDRGCWAPAASRDGRTAAASQPGCASGSEQWEGRSGQGSVTGGGAERGRAARQRGTLGWRGNGALLKQQGSGAALGHWVWQPQTAPARNGFEQQGAARL
jgi:hypothetical protein